MRWLNSRNAQPLDLRVVGFFEGLGLGVRRRTVGGGSEFVDGKRRHRRKELSEHTAGCEMRLYCLQRGGVS